MLCWFLAVSVLSLGSATAIGFAAPLFTTLLSIVILKEKVGIHRWSALIVGFVGVLIITHPGAGTLTYGALFALGNAVLISTVAIAIRRMSMTESTETLTLYQMSIMTLCTAGLLTLGFRAPHWADALMVALAGVGNGIAQFWWTRSLSLAPPSAVVPFNYLSLVWAAILGFAVWGDVPTAEPAGRLGDRGRLGPLHPVARDLAAAAPACPGPAGRRGRARQACLKKRSALPAISFGRCSGFIVPFQEILDRLGELAFRVRIVGGVHQHVVAEKAGDGRRTCRRLRGARRCRNSGRSTGTRSASS